MAWTRKVVLSLLSLLAVAVGPSPAAAADAALYEVFENMAMVRRDGHDYREGWAALMGTARPGTLLCPLAVRCEIHSLGSSRVDVATGKGTFSGYLTVVVQGDNPADGPEATVLTGRFGGSMDFSPALVFGKPYGTVVGTVTVGSVSSGFTAVFHLPFAFPDDPTKTPYYLTFTGPQPSGVVPVGDAERALGEPMVKFEICLGSSGC
ncbi:MAG: hypothetical protein DMD97_00120 [Candidatus Rokuibacteriota bacterium]|nr:MAG: hypothetical protein DMD97_00120 [Candidatus Rokubacteria bacterium]